MSWPAEIVAPRSSTWTASGTAGPRGTAWTATAEHSQDSEDSDTVIHFTVGDLAFRHARNCSDSSASEVTQVTHTPSGTKLAAGRYWGRRGEGRLDELQHTADMLRHFRATARELDIAARALAAALPEPFAKFATARLA